VPEELFYDVGLWLILAVSIGSFLLATEAGFLLGRRSRSSSDDQSKSQVYTIQGAALGLLALLLGFTFAMAMSRYDLRKQMVLEESNAIGTTFLRAQLLPEPQRKEVSNLLRRYVEVRLEFYAAVSDQKMLREVSDKTEQLHNQLWALGVAVGEKDPRAVTTGLFLQSLNETIDLHAKRLTAVENHVPEITLVLLYFVAVMATGLIGYGCGLSGLRNFFVTIISSILIAAVIMVIIDLDRPIRGLIRVSQQRMIDLRDNLKAQ
jgi:flagellar basal body-associated protein FliL